MAQQFGQQEWDSVEIKSNNGPMKSSKDLYLRLEPGENRIRIVTKPFQYLMHKYVPNSPNYKGFGERVYSSLPNGSDPLKDLTGKGPTRKWLIGVIDRKTQSYKLLDMGPGIFKGVQELTRDSDWGNPSMYDISIKVDPKGGATGYYTVIPKNKKPLSPADLEIQQEADLEDLARRTTPPTPEKMQERIDFINNKFGVVAGTPPVPTKAAVTATQKAAAPVAKKAAVVVSTNDEFDEMFPNVDEE